MLTRVVSPANFIRFLNHINVPTAITSMTFGVSRDKGEFEWSGTGKGIFAQRSNIFRLRMWLMIFEIVRFNQFALNLLGDQVTAPDGHAKVEAETPAGDRELSIGQYLDREGYSQAFRDDYLIPMTAAVWSTSPDKTSLDFPAMTLVRFMWNHHLLSTVATRPDWLTIPGGSQKYIDAIIKRSDPDRFHVHLSSSVTSVRRRPGQRTIVTWIDLNSKQTSTSEFDHVVYACHGDEILPTLDSPTDLERSLLSTFQTTENLAYLHSDTSLMPKRRAAWTAWNYLTTSHPSAAAHPAGVSLTYWMNLLQHISEDQYGPVLVTMNPPHAPAADKTQGKFVYRHPLYTHAAVQAQRRLDEIQDVDGISYCGAWTKYGFHEDGFSSGLKVAQRLGASLPFEFVDSTFSRGNTPVFNVWDRVLRMLILVVHAIILLMQWSLDLPPVRWAREILHESHHSTLHHTRRKLRSH